MCASTTVVYPCVIPRDTNKRKSDIPVMISPFRIGILFTKPIALRERAFKLKDDMNINMKFKDFAELYLSDIQPRIKYNSFLTKKHIIETKILPYFGRRKLNEIRPADVIQWQNEIMKLKSNKTFL